MSHEAKADETKFNETLKRMLKSPPKPHKGSPAKSEAPQKKVPAKGGKPK